MAFNWLRFLHDHNIEFVDRGSNVARGHVNIRCPFCGVDDPSHHMGINLETGAWGCWRSASHRGRGVLGLVRELLPGRANLRSILKQYESSGLDLEESELISSLKPGSDSTGKGILKIPSKFRPLSEMLLSSVYRRITSYLIRRGFGGVVNILSTEYEIYGCLSGEWRDRVIFPFRLGADLMTWQGRTVNNVDVRYKALSRDGDGEGNAAILRTSDLLWNFDDLRREGGKVLVLVEGVFDALKVDLVGRAFGVRATCLSTRSVSEMQRGFLVNLLVGESRFKSLVLIPDEDSNVFWMERELAWLHPRKLMLPRGVKDTGEMDFEELSALLSDIL